jgi:DNA modification methylase
MIIEKKKLSELKPAPYNPRQSTEKQETQLKHSLEKFGVVEPIIYNKQTGYIVGGHFRVRELKKLGYKEIECVIVDLNEEDERELNIRLNANTGEWDWSLLAEWDSEQLEEWGLEVPSFATEVLEAEEDYFDTTPPEEPITVLGDLYEIGEHRLLCGDSTDSDQVAKLMNGEKADIAFTSPPYNAGTTPTEIKMGKKSKYANDSDNKDENEYLKLLIDFTNNSLLFCEYSFVNIQSLSGNKTALIDFLYNLKSIYADTLIWNKQNAQPAMANNVLNSQFEYVHVFSTKANRAIGTKEFRGTLSNVIDISKQSANKVKEHNATFPIDFASFFISNFCENSIIDLFCGSGTTMVVSHQLKRKCYGMELDPKYCDVIVKRMVKLDPTLIVKRNGVVTKDFE